MNIIFEHPNSTILENYPPVPAKKSVPEWYKTCPMEKKIESSNPIQGLLEFNELLTVKHCVPVQDYITSGYIIRNAFEIELTALTGDNDQVEDIKHLSVNEWCVGFHGYEQLPVKLDDKKKNYFKINHGWRIKTPPGYSCLIIQPFYHFEKRYTLLPAVVDTDTFDASIVLPGFLNSNETVRLMPGDPLAQVIPFKRDEWTSTFRKQQSGTIVDLFIPKAARQIYKRFFHQKKIFK